MSNDARGWRMALVPDALVNPTPAHGAVPLDVLSAIEAAGYGVLQLPPIGEYRLLLGVIADQIAEYSHHGYGLVAIKLGGAADDGLHWRRLAPLLRHRGVALPPRHLIRPDAGAALERQRLMAFLTSIKSAAAAQNSDR